jgi:DNA-binding NarL/FixJ family response regulator
VEELRELAALGATPPLRAIADRAEGIARRSRALLEDAVDGFETAPYEAAQTRRALAQLLAGPAAEREREAARRTLRELGAGEPPLPQLTPREREVVALLAEGLTNREIGGRLVVSEHTVHRHVTNILRKLDAPSRAAAVALAARHRVI